MNKKSVSYLIYFLLLISAVTSVFHGNVAPVFGQSPSHLTNELIAQAIGSSDPAEADRALVESLRRGERMFIPLLQNKGDSRPFNGHFFERPLEKKKCPPFLRKDGGDTRLAVQKVPVTVEVATLFLISAIYHDQRLDFAPYPHLMSNEDTYAWFQLLRVGKTSAGCPYHLHVSPEVFGEGMNLIPASEVPEINSTKQISVASKAVENWVISVKKDGLNKLRYQKCPPLGEAGVSFIYTSVRIGNHFELDADGSEVNPWLTSP